MIDFGAKTVLTFDCYGTLIDWERGLLAALRPVLRRHDRQVADADLLEHYARLEASIEAGPYRPYAEVLAAVMDGLGAQLDFEPTAADRRALATSVGNWPPFGDTVAALQRLHARYKLAIVSNIDDDLFAASNRQLGVTFDWIITAQQAGAYKPSEQVFQLALERIGAPAGEVLHVAQSLYHDHVPAHALRLQTVWVNRRHAQSGSGATPPANARPDLEVPDLRTLAERAA